MAARDLRTIGQGLIVIAILLFVIAAALWLRPDFASPATERFVRAEQVTTGTDGQGVPDAGKQRLLLVEETRALNLQVKALAERLGSIDKALREGEYKVQTVEAKSK